MRNEESPSNPSEAFTAELAQLREEVIGLSENKRDGSVKLTVRESIMYMGAAFLLGMFLAIGVIAEIFHAGKCSWNCN